MGCIRDYLCALLGTAKNFPCTAKFFNVLWLQHTQLGSSRQ